MGRSMDQWIRPCWQVTIISTIELRTAKKMVMPGSCNESKAQDKDMCDQHKKWNNISVMKICQSIAIIPRLSLHRNDLFSPYKNAQRWWCPYQPPWHHMVISDMKYRTLKKPLLLSSMPGQGGSFDTILWKLVSIPLR